MYINWKRKELTVTIAFYGPQGSGKSTTWRFLSQKATEPLEAAADMFQLRLDKMDGLQLILQVRDTPGAPEAAEQRRVAMYGVDGFIFVVDSDPVRADANEAALAELEANLVKMNKSLVGLPLFLQFNKRDLATAVPPAALQEQLDPQQQWTYQETCATQAEGLIAVLQQVTDITLQLAMKQ